MYKKFTYLLVILASFILVLLIKFRLNADLFGPASTLFWIVSLSGLALVLFIYNRWTASPPRCSLFYGSVRRYRYDSEGNVTGSEKDNEQCGKKSIGRVKVLSNSRGGSTEHFCAWHHPEKKWMKEWLAKEGIKIYPDTIKIFPETEDADEGPDLIL